MNKRTRQMREALGYDTYGESTEKTNWAWSVAGYFFLFALGLLGYEVYEYLQSGYWYSHTVLVLLGMPSVHAHAEWVGAWDILYYLLSFHASAVAMMVGVGLFIGNDS